MEWRRCRWTRQRSRKATSRLLLVLRLQEVRRLFGQPVEQVPRLPEPAVVRRGAEHDDGYGIALGQPEERGEAVAGLADEARLPAHHVDIADTHETIGAVDGEGAPVRRDLVLGRAHDRRDAIVRRGKRDEPGQVVGR